MGIRTSQPRSTHDGLGTIVTQGTSHIPILAPPARRHARSRRCGSARGRPEAPQRTLAIDPANPSIVTDGANSPLDTRVRELEVWTGTEVLPGARPWSGMRARAVDVHTSPSGVFALPAVRA
jgi:hypothetical protein